MTLSGNSINHLNIFITKIDKCEPFAIIRLGDGEHMILTGKHFKTQDKWSYCGGVLQNNLAESIHLLSSLQNSFIGIACPACSITTDAQKWYMDTFKIPENKITYANIFCNKNWEAFVNYFINTGKKFYYIGPGTRQTDKLKIIDRLIINELQIEKWDLEKDVFISNIKKWVDDKLTNINDTTLFIFSAGPLAKVLIPLFFKKYPNHQFVDCGSAFDLFLKGSTNRPYTRKNHQYSKLICDFEKGHSYV